MNPVGRVSLQEVLYRKAGNKVNKLNVNVNVLFVMSMGGIVAKLIAMQPSSLYFDCKVGNNILSVMHMVPNMAFLLPHDKNVNT